MDSHPCRPPPGLPPGQSAARRPALAECRPGRHVQHPLPGRRPSADGGGAKELRESLAAERDMNKKLRARIDLLETDKKVLAQETPGGAGKTDKLAAFREKLRKLKKVMKDPAFKDGSGVEPDNMVELTETMM